MSLLDALLLGVIQGLTEFLPISSSGHLVFFQKLLGYKESLITFDIILHLGTLLAILIYFFKDIYALCIEGVLLLFRAPKIKEWDRYFHSHVPALTCLYALVTTGVTLGVLLVFKDVFEQFFGSVKTVGFAWIVMGIALIWSKRIEKENSNFSRGFYQMTHRDCFVIGVAQGFALIPGISRSGSTIIAGMASGLDSKTAARFSFFIGLIAIAGAGLLQAKEGVELFQENAGALLAGFFSSFIVGFLAISFLMKLIEKGKFFIFGFYCCGMGILVFILMALGKL